MPPLMNAAAFFQFPPAHFFFRLALFLFTLFRFFSISPFLLTSVPLSPAGAYVGTIFLRQQSSISAPSLSRILTAGDQILKNKKFTTYILKILYVSCDKLNGDRQW